MNQIPSNPVAKSNLKFDYQEAFSRNIGWVTEDEQQILRSKKVAIAGVGGVGGVHLLTLTRLGVGKFHIADLDTFEQGNFNRQAGAFMHTVGRPKADVMKEMALQINPSAEIKVFSSGVTEENIADFLDGVDLYIDGLDFFVLDIRQKVFAVCAGKGIPAITAAPLGMGVAFLAFLPGRMTFEDYFRLQGQTEEEQQLRFLLGLAPSRLHMSYLADPTRIDLKNKKGPSTPMGCELCAGVAATNALNLLLHRGNVVAAPRGLHFDAYENRLRKTWLPFGNNNPLQRLLLLLARKTLLQKLSNQKTAHTQSRPATIIERILDLARWAPSGDNTQPWRFEILDDHHFRIHAHDTRDWCFYDLKGQASQIAVGALLETIDIAASGEGISPTFTRQKDAGETSPIIDVELLPSSREPSPLLPYLRVRCTNRRPYKRTPLNAHQKQQMEQSLGEGCRVIWIEGRKRWDMARLLFKSAKIRLTTEEGYRVHSQIIEWNSQFSETKIPDKAVGLDPLAINLMKWALQSWQRVKFLNKYLAGTWIPRTQLDLIPALQCGAHFVLVADKPLESIDGFMAGGRALQRFWLTATKLGLQFQPEMTPLIFARYAANNEAFTGDEAAADLAKTVLEVLSTHLPDSGIENAVFMGRLGIATAPTARSLRLPVNSLLR